MSIRGKAAIVGVGISDHGEVPGWSHFELMAQAVERACADAGIAVVSLPMCNMYLQGRTAGRTPRWRGVTLTPSRRMIPSR